MESAYFAPLSEETAGDNPLDSAWYCHDFTNEVDEVGRIK